MKLKPRHLAHLNRVNKRPGTAEMSLLSTTESAAGEQIRLQGSFFSIVDRRGFMK
jgi:hypothetical protein